MNADVASCIASFCGDTRRSFAVVCRDWSHFFSLDHVWETCLFADFGISGKKLGPAKHSGDGFLFMETKITFREAWLAWRQFELEMNGTRILYGQIWLRAIEAFETIRNELKGLGCLQNLRLRPGNLVLPHRLLQKFSNQPLTLETIRAIWGTHDGQETGLKSGGLFGLTQFYNHSRALRLLSLQEMSNELGDEFTLVVAKSNTVSPPQMEEKLCFDPRELQIGNSYQRQGRAFNSLIFPIRGDVLLVLFESFARDLHEYKRSVFPIYQGARHLSSFPQAGSPCTSQVETRGITVLASYKYLPQQQQGRDLFVYQLQISASPEVPRVMLISRHWTFVDSLAPQVPDIIEGEGVVGKFPIFQGSGRHGEAMASLGNIVWQQGNFMYQSCTYAHPKSYMEGYLTFAPILGNRLDMANAFQVRVGRLNFVLPMFAY